MRNEAREKAFQLIFERLFVKDSYGPDEEFFACLKKEEDKDFANEIVTKFSENRPELESLVEANLIGYSLSRVYKVDLALIFMALTEIKFCNTPFQVAINETLDIAKRYSTEKSSRFINGVLSAILKTKN